MQGGGEGGEMSPEFPTPESAPECGHCYQVYFSVCSIFTIFTVFGWLQSSLVGPERSESYTVNVGYEQGTGSTLAVDVVLAPGSETSECIILYNL